MKILEWIKLNKVLFLLLVFIIIILITLSILFPLLLKNPILDLPLTTNALIASNILPYDSSYDKPKILFNNYNNIYNNLNEYLKIYFPRVKLDDINSIAINDFNIVEPVENILKNTVNKTYDFNMNKIIDRYAILVDYLNKDELNLLYATLLHTNILIMPDNLIELNRTYPDIKEFNFFYNKDELLYNNKFMLYGVSNINKNKKGLLYNKDLIKYFLQLDNVCLKDNICYNSSVSAADIQTYHKTLYTDIKTVDDNINFITKYINIIFLHEILQTSNYEQQIIDKVKNKRLEMKAKVEQLLNIILY